MKSKQLANVLIKIIGLYVCLCAIPELATGIAAALLRIAGTPHVNNDLWALTNAIGAGVQAGVGIFLIVKSRKIAEFWFKNDDE
jgi:hypothetical protein